MTEGKRRKDHQELDKMDLIKIVRSLDQKGPGDDGENLQVVWKSLVASTESPYHAAEESSLRWLLKSMNGSSEGAELLRRYPLTWVILDCVVRRVPLFSLAKSLADRRFIAILQQTLKEISKPTPDSASSASPKRKRKRSDGQAFDLASLQTRKGCIATGQAIFLMLKCLLARLDSPTVQSSSDKIGSEHIRSLFCTSAADAVAVVRPLLLLCTELLGYDGREDVEGRSEWIDTVSKVWDLHLQGNDDALNVAMHLFTPSSLILARLEKLSPQNGEDVEEGLSHRWASDIQRFLHKNFISPARSAFTNHQDDSVLSTALEVSQGQAENSIPCLYFLAVADFKMSARHGLRKSNLDWMKKVFQAVETGLRRRQDRNQLMRIILEQAVHQSVAVNVDDLRRVAQEYALPTDTTDWPLLARLGECDPEVFHTPEDAGELLDELCKRSVSNNTPSDLASISQVLGAIMQGYRTGRDFSGFLKLWFGQMRRATQQGKDTTNPWLSVAHLNSQQEPFESLIEKELLPTRLVEVVQWAAQQDADATSDCIFAEAIARGVRSEPFIDALGRDLFDLIWRTNSSSSPRTALRWRVVSKTMSWISPQERPALWETIRPRITGILEKSAVKSWETFEAFKCCSQIWVSMSPDDENIKVVASATEAFLLRLTKEITASKALRTDAELIKPGEDVDKAEFSEETAFENYLLYYLRGCSRLGRFVFAQQERPALPLAQALETRKTDVSALKKRWDAIFENEVGLNTVGLTNQALTLLLDTFEGADSEKRWPSAQAQMCMRVLSRVPLDTFDREQRERAMKVLNKGSKRMLQSVKKSELNSWKLVFSLATKLLSRPTFYEDMSFKDVSDVADGMSGLSFDISTSSGTALEMIERFSLLARTSFKQMAEHVDERSIRYFTEALPFISESHKLATTAEEDKANSTPVRITLLKALVTEMSQSPSCRNHAELSKVLQNAQEALSACIVHTVGILLSEKKVFKHRDIIIDLGLFAVVDASGTLESLSGLSKQKQSTIRKLDKRSKEAMEEGDARGWAVQTFLRTHLSSELEMSRPTKIGSLADLPTELRTRLLKDFVDSIVRSMDHNERMEYLQGLINEFKRGCDTDGQALAIYHVTTQLLEPTESQAESTGYDLAVAHADLMSTLSLAQDASVFIRQCEVLQALLEKRSQSMTQWNIELTLSTISHLCSPNASSISPAFFVALCKLVEIVIKKHRLRLEGHFHLLLSTLQALLSVLVHHKSDAASEKTSHLQPMAQSYARLITLVCEPTAGAVSRTRQQSQLDSATDVAKRAAGRHMYFILMHYVKLQLESPVSSEVLVALEPAMNSIFDITPPEARKILNDAMDASGRAILREMFQRYTKFGKWSGV